jgi:hypothetical protein
MVYCDCAFSQPGGKSVPLGKIAKRGFSSDQLRKLCASLTSQGIGASIVDLRAEAVARGAPASWVERMDEAVVLVIRDGANVLTDDPEMADKMLREHEGLEYDKTTVMYRKVCVARSRRNLHFADEGRPEDMANGRNTVVAWTSVPANARCHRVLTELLGTTDVTSAVANHYPDPAKCGIGWHGDAERRQTIMVRLGAGSNTRPIHFLWCGDGAKIASPITIDLQHGDVMVPCAKAVGTDYHQKRVPTVRHGTGFPSGKSVLLTHPAVARPAKRQRD